MGTILSPTRPSASKRKAVSSPCGSRNGMSMASARISLILMNILSCQRSDILILTAQSISSPVFPDYQQYWLPATTPDRRGKRGCWRAHPPQIAAACHSLASHAQCQRNLGLNGVMINAPSPLSFHCVTRTLLAAFLLLADGRLGNRIVPIWGQA